MKDVCSADSSKSQYLIITVVSNFLLFIVYRLQLSLLDPPDNVRQPPVTPETSGSPKRQVATCTFAHRSPVHINEPIIVIVDTVSRDKEDLHSLSLTKFIIIVIMMNKIMV
jgi:hypothetical protein